MMRRTMACHLCGGTEFSRLYSAKDRLGTSDDAFDIVRCRTCGLVRTCPDMTDAELAKFYPDTYWGDAHPAMEWIRASQSEKTTFLSTCGPQQGRVLDVGCGSGLFLAALDAARWQRFGVETGVSAAGLAQRILGATHVFTGTLMQSRAAGWLPADDDRFDVVTLWSVLEHVNDPRETLIEVRRRLTPGGTMILQLPNVASHQARWFKGDWFSLDAPRHRHHFDTDTLTRLLSETGFTVYRRTLFSRSHNLHALRQSLKARLRGTALGRPLFLLSIPFLMPLDYTMTALGSGATMTVAARA